jgi:hypothetical protein
MSYLDWNDAIGDYYFHAGQDGRLVTFYMDRRRIEDIGRKHGLGGWPEFILAIRTPIPMMPNRSYLGPHNPLLQLGEMLYRWKWKLGYIQGRPVKSMRYPTMLAGIALLVLAWTEADDPDEHSYYDRLQAFCLHHFVDLDMSDRYVLESTAKSLIEGFPLVQEWLEENHQRQWGRLATGKRNQHKFVGAIRYHALLDPEERDLLPALWTEMGILAHAPLTAAFLVENALLCTWFDNYFPSCTRRCCMTRPGWGH